MDKLTLYDYTLLTDLAVRKFIDENGFTDEEKEKLQQSIDSYLTGAFYLPDLINTISDLLCKIYAKNESNEILKDIAKRELKYKRSTELYTGSLEKIDRYALFCGLMDYLEQEIGGLSTFREIWESNYMNRIN